MKLDPYDCDYIQPKYWEVKQVSPTEIHVYPVHDWEDHIFTQSCGCKPEISNGGALMVVVHDAYDARDTFETLDGLNFRCLNH